MSREFERHFESATELLVELEARLQEEHQQRPGDVIKQKIEADIALLEAEGVCGVGGYLLIFAHAVHFFAAADTPEKRRRALEWQMHLEDLLLRSDGVTGGG